MYLGIFFGILAALFQDMGYVFARIFMQKYKNSLEILTFTQILMGAASLVILPVVWVDGFWRDGNFFGFMAVVALGSLGGQLFFFLSEKKIDPSRLASLMGLRVMLVALILFIAGKESYDGYQISGIILAVLSAIVMNYMHGRLNFNGMGYLGVSLLCYCFSDLSIPWMIGALPVSTALLHKSLLAMCVVNIFLGILFLPMMWRYQLKNSITVMPFAGVWLVKQLFLYSCFAAVGAVFGNVILSSRGIFSVLISLVLIRMHVQNISDHVISLRGWLRRGIAAIMMVAAVVIYSWEKIF